MNAVYHRLSIPLALSMASGIAVAAGVPGAEGGVWLLLGIAMGVTGWRVARRQVVRMSPLVCFFSLGYLLILPWINAPTSTNPESGWRRSGPLDLSARVVTMGGGGDGRNRFVLEDVRLESPAIDRPVPGRLRGTLFADSPPFGDGDRIRFRGTPRPIRNFENPGRFDYRRYLALQGIQGSVFLKTGAFEVVAESQGGGPGAWVRAIRTEVARRIDAAASETAAGILRALLIADRNGISPDTRRIFDRSGTGHLLAISGLHVGTIAATAFFLFGYGLRWIPLLTERGWVQRGAALGTLLPVAAYAVLAGGSPSTQRAVLMVALFLATFWVDRDGDLLNFIAVAAMAIFIFDPPAVLTLSFQLSFGAVTAIVLGMGRWSPSGNGAPSWLRRFGCKLFQLVMVSVLAVLGTLPLAMRAFGEVSLIGPLVNCIAVPLVGFAVLPVGLLAVCVSWLSPAAAEWGFGLAGRLLEVMMAFLERVSAMPFAAVNVPSPTGIEVALYFGFLGIVLVPVTPLARRRLLVLVLAMVLCDALYWCRERFWHKDLRVTVLDVGQGSATLAELPGGRVMLVDGGGFSSNRTFDIGERVLAPVLRRKKILTVDTVVLSHPNADHMNGLVAICDRFRVGEVWTNGEVVDTEGYGDFIRMVHARGIPMRRVDRDTRELRFAGVRIAVLNPLPGFSGKSGAAQRGDVDDHSIVLKLTYQRRSILLPGDVRESAELEILDAFGAGPLDSDILLAPHHGSRYSSSQPFMDAVSPDVMVISAGLGNRFGFPHPDVLDRCGLEAGRIFRTDLDGAVEIRTVGGAVRVSGWASGRRLSLAPAGTPSERG